MKVFEPQFRAIINYVILFAIAEVCSGALSCFTHSLVCPLRRRRRRRCCCCVRERIRDRSLVIKADDMADRGPHNNSLVTWQPKEKHTHKTVIGQII